VKDTLFCPGQSLLPETDAVSKILDSQILWPTLSGANLMVAPGVGVPSNHSTNELSIFKGRDSGQSDLVLLNQP
jgi:hypothetical protein